MAVDPTNTGDPSAMKGRSTPIAEWAIRHAANLVNGARSAFRAPSSAVQTPPAQRLTPTVVLPPARPADTPTQPLAATQLTPMYRSSAAGWPAPRREPWFGPGTPPTPQAPAADVAGRAFDYRANENMQGKPRQYSGLTFEQLRGMADSLDVVRLCIETRKDQIGGLSWSFLPKQQPGEQMRAKADPRCMELNSFFERPDGRVSWDTWVRMLLEELFVIDAPAIYIRRTLGGSPFALEIVDGSTIKPLLDVTGRTPLPPQNAYQQILKGMPAIDYTSEELIYSPRNRRANHVYGLSVVEQICMTINIAIRREVVKLQYFTSGNIPEALIGVPEEWTPETIARWQTQWDNTLADSRKRAGARFVPGKMVVQNTRSDGMLQGPFDEWVARVVCFAFSLPPTAFVQQMNRATADTAKETALEEGLRPTMTWLKALMDHLAQNVWGYTDIELVYDDVEDLDIEVERQSDLADVAAGILSIDEVRAKRGLDPIGIGNAIMGGPNGLIFLADLARAQQQGLTAIQPPPPPQQFDEFGNPLPPPPTATPGAPPPQGMLPPPNASAPDMPPPDDASDPPPGSTGIDADGPVAPQAMTSSELRPGVSRAPSQPDPLAGIPADILAAVGLGPQGSSGRSANVTRSEEIASDPETAHVGHPNVLATLRGAEALHRSRGK